MMGVMAFDVVSVHDILAAAPFRGYFGPFGVDAFSYVQADRLKLNPLGELNARLTMAYAGGMRAVARSRFFPVTRCFTELRDVKQREMLVSW